MAVRSLTVDRFLPPFGKYPTDEVVERERKGVQVIEDATGPSLRCGVVFDDGHLADVARLRAGVDALSAYLPEIRAAWRVYYRESCPVYAATLAASPLDEAAA